MRVATVPLLLALVVFSSRARAEGCTTPADCTSGFCVDGVCCNVACDGVCEACDVEGTKGTCTPVAGAPKHGNCPTSADECGNAQCDGVTRGECKKLPGAEKECRASACTEGIETLAARCDGMGACPALATKACNEYVCDGTKCRTTCRSSPDCATGFVCDEIDKKCVPASMCDGDHTITGRNGETKDCSPYKCDKTECLNACLSTSQCTTGFTCNGKECVRTTADVPAGEDDGGCAMAGAPGGAPGVSLVVLGLAITARLVNRARRNRADGA
jgi:hypothetical protein